MMSKLFLAGRFLAEGGGPTAVEYAAMLALVALAAVGAISALGGGVGDALRAFGDLAGR